ncbi:uncharacterized acetyltransferase At3g50280-like [Abrus precatorius]|uniref:Uncharacterized acetyltransferase At3g50280-like n=1 Tax=Abrus precatorius TaxID=3816 RepID=A0A8B8ML00_ABRPR|nr:uncharacterized acetyltransferase At3g50280-like [Abrus precatorius]
MSTSAVQRVSECFIKPQKPTKDSDETCYLTPWDLAMLSMQYIQRGLLFKKTASVDDNQDFIIQNLLDKLKHSLSQTLFHFYPLVGHLVTRKTQDPPSYSIFIDCTNSDGAKFIYATLDMTISDILSPVDVPPIVQSLFDHQKALNHDGHTIPLLSVQVTELVDGVFIGCSMNHAVADGPSFWNFMNTWSEIFKAQAQGHEYDIPISHQPVLKRWFPEGCDPLINLPFKHHQEFIRREEPLLVRERIFHFSAESIAKLKAKANAESNTSTISSFQSLSALIWRSITRARRIPHDKTTSFNLAITNRTRMEPPLSPEYFGNAFHGVGVGATAGELLENNLGWAAWKLHLAVANYNNTVVQQHLKQWLQRPMIYQLSWSVYTSSVTMGGSTRFNAYEIEFGIGKVVAVRNGHAIKFDGHVLAYPGREGGGSVDFEVSLFPENMSALESDEEFMNAVSASNPLP